MSNQETGVNINNNINNKCQNNKESWQRLKKFEELHIGGCSAAKQKVFLLFFFFLEEGGQTFFLKKFEELKIEGCSAAKQELKEGGTAC